MKTHKTKVKERITKHEELFRHRNKLCDCFKSPEDKLSEKESATSRQHIPEEFRHLDRIDAVPIEFTSPTSKQNRSNANEFINKLKKQAKEIGGEDFPFAVVDIRELSHQLNSLLDDVLEKVGDDEPFYPCDNCENPNQMSDKRCHNCSLIKGRNSLRFQQRKAIEELRRKV